MIVLMPGYRGRFHEYAMKNWRNKTSMSSAEPACEEKARNRMIARSSFRVEVFVIVCFCFSFVSLVGNKISCLGQHKIEIDKEEKGMTEKNILYVQERMEILFFPRCWGWQIVKPWISQ